MKKRQGVLAASLVFFFLAVVWLLPRFRGADAAAVMAWSPDRPAPAALFLLTLYAVKGLSFFFPLAVLEAAGGLMFPLWQALALNLLGVAAAMSLPYLLGRRERDGLESLTVRFPRLKKIRELRQGGDFLFVFLVRLTGVFPCDAASFYFGAAGIPFRVYLPAGLLGALPHLIAVTVLGSALSNPASEAFFLSIAMNAAVTVGALTIWRLRKKKGAA